MLSEHGNAARHLDHVDDAVHRFCLRRVERLDLPTEHRRACDDTNQQTRTLHVDAESGRAGDLGQAVEARRRFADQGPLRRILEGDLVRRLELGRGIGEFAIACAVRARDDATLFGAAGRGIDLPALRRGIDQQRARHRPGLAHLAERLERAGRSARALDAERIVRVDLRIRRVLDAHLRPVAIEFLGDDHRYRGPHALAHLRMLEHDGHAVVAADVHEGIRVHRRRRRRPAFLGEQAARAERHEAGDDETAGQAGRGRQELPPRRQHRLARIRTHDASPRPVRPRDARRSGCAGRCRSGRCCRPSRRRYRRRSVSVCSPAGPPPP